MAILYHGCISPLTDETVREGDLFNGMFFSYSKEAARSHGSPDEYCLYTTEIPDEQIADVTKLQYDERALAFAQKRYGEKDADDMLDLICNDVNLFTDKNAVETVRRVLVKIDSAVEYYETYELSWALQCEASIIAEALGYKAVEVPDEHGTSVIVCPGANMEKIEEYKCREE